MKYISVNSKQKTMNKTDYLINYIKQNTKPVEAITDDHISIFKWLSQEIYAGKAPLKSKSVHFIIVKILNRKGQTNDIKQKDFFDVYVIGDFRKTFTPALKVAEAFTTFYMEMGVLPNIITLPKTVIQKNIEILHKLKNGVLIYERR